MLAQFDHSLNISVHLWAQNVVQQNAQGYFNATMQFYPTADARYTGYYSYSCPWKQLVFDSGVSGAQILNAVSGGGFSAPLTRDSGVHFDYLNGRVLVPQALGGNLALTGAAAVSEINFYQPNATEEYMLTQTKYFRNPRYQGTPTTGVDPYVMATPAVFINTIDDRSEAFSFGGIDNTMTTFTLTCFAESDYQLKGLFSLFRDERYGYIPLINIAQNPLDGYNDVKGGTGFNYQSIIAQYGTPGNLIYVQNVKTSKVSDKMQLNPGLFAGIIDMELSFIRQPS
jgi:hypothetical protein